MVSRRALPVLDDLRAEANAVTATGTGHQFEIQLGHLCNNRCVFCSSGQLTDMKLARPVPLAPVLDALSRARATGARRVTFLGGEPTIHKGFPEALAHAASLGFEEIVIFTNGVMFPHPGFIASVIAHGPRVEWRVSIQGGDESAHVAVTGRADSFRRIEHGLRELRARGQRVTANACVNEQSYRALPKYADLVREHGIAQLHLDIVRPSSTGQRSEAELRAMMPKYTDMAAEFRAMLERFAQELPDFDVNVGNLPFCVLPEWSDRIHHGGDETVTQACDTDGLEVAVDKYDWHFGMRAHPAGCDGCVFRPRCSGVYREYLALHGDGEFRAVTADALRAMDPARRAFVLLAGPRVDAMVASITAPWVVREQQRDARRREIELSLGTDTGGRATLRVLPPGALTAPDARETDLDLSLAIPAETSPTERDALLDALIAAGCALDRDALVARHMGERARRRARSIERALRTVGPAQGWSAGEARTEGDVVVLPLRDGRARVEVVIAPAGVDFRLADGSTVERAKPLVDKVIRALGAMARTVSAARQA